MHPHFVSLELNSAIDGPAYLRLARPLVWPLGAWFAWLLTTPFGVPPAPVPAGQHTKAERGAHATHLDLSLHRSSSPHLSGC